MIIGIQYSVITANDDILPLKTRIRSALEHIFNIYGIGRETRQTEIDKVINMECGVLGKRVLAEFLKYVKEENGQAFSEMLKSHRKSKRK